MAAHAHKLANIPPQMRRQTPPPRQLLQASYQPGAARVYEDEPHQGLSRLLRARRSALRTSSERSEHGPDLCTGPSRHRIPKRRYTPDAFRQDLRERRAAVLAIIVSKEYRVPPRELQSPHQLPPQLWLAERQRPLQQLRLRVPAAETRQRFKVAEVLLPDNLPRRNGDNDVFVLNEKRKLLQVLSQPHWSEEGVAAGPNCWRAQCSCILPIARCQCCCCSRLGLARLCARLSLTDFHIDGPPCKALCQRDAPRDIPVAERCTVPDDPDFQVFSVIDPALRKYGVVYGAHQTELHGHESRGRPPPCPPRAKAEGACGQRGAAWNDEQ